MVVLDDLPDDLIDSFFLRIPSDDLASLLRASVVCKRWHRILADPHFHRRHRELHRRPVLGLIHVVNAFVGYQNQYHSRFVPIDSEFHRPPAREFPGWLVLDCRCGRALFVTPAEDQDSWDEGILDFIVWDPLRDPEQHERLPRPEKPPVFFRRNFNAAVLCAADVADGYHLDCRRGDFRVAYVWSLPYDPFGGDDVTFATMYSSETGAWSEPISLNSNDDLHAGTGRFFLGIRPCPSALAGAALYFRGASRRHALKYKLGVLQQPLSVIQAPPLDVFNGHFILFMSPQGGGLGFAGVEHELLLSLWSGEIAPNDGDVQWARRRTIVFEDVHIQYPVNPLVPPFFVAGFAEGTDVIFLAVLSNGHHDIYMFELDSQRARMVLADSDSFVFPLKTFCVPVTALQNY